MLGVACVPLPLRPQCCCGHWAHQLLLTAPPSPPQMKSQKLWQPSCPSTLLIPQPRGGRAQRAAYVLLALCAAGLYVAGEPLVPTARSVTFHLLALQIGALLKGTCYLAEEIFHLQSR